MLGEGNSVDKNRYNCHPIRRVSFFIVFFGGEIVQAMFPLGIGIAISYILLPLVDYFEKIKIPRTVGILFAILFSIIVILAIFIWLIPILANNIKELTRVLPELFSSVFNDFISFIEKNVPENWHSDIMQEIDNLFLNIQQRIFAGLYGLISLLPKTLSLIIDVLIGWILSFYILKDKELIVETSNIFS